MAGVIQVVRHSALLLLTVFTIAACGGGGGGGGSSPTPTSSPAPDIEPEAFAPAAPQTGVAVSQPFDFPEFEVAGIDTAVPITITGGSYAIGEGEFTMAAGEVSAGDRVRVQVMAAEAFSTSTAATLSIGSGSGDFVVESEAEDTSPDAFDFGDAATVNAPEQEVESPEITVAGINSSAAISVDGGEYRIGEGAYITEAGTVVAGDRVQVRVVSASLPPGTASAALSIGDQSASFTVSTVDDTPPVAQVMFPTPSTLTDGNSITLRGNASDDFGPIASIRVSVTSNDGSIEVDSDVLEAAEGDDFSQTWSLNVSLGSETLNTIRVEAIDAAGNVQAAPTVLTMLQTADAGRTHFPAGNDVFLGESGSTSGIDFDEENNRLIMTGGVSKADDIISISLLNGVRSVFIQKNEAFGSVNNVYVASELGRLFIADGYGNAVFSSPLTDPVVTLLTDENNQTSNTDIRGVYGMRFNNTDGFLYVTDPGADQLFKVDVDTGGRTLVSDNNTADTNIPFGQPRGLILDEQSKRAIIADLTLAQVLSVDLSTGAREEIIPDDSTLVEPWSLAWFETGRRAVLVDIGLQTLFSVDIEGKTASPLVSDTVPENAANSIDIPWSVTTDEVKKIGFLVTGEAFAIANSAVKVIDLTTGERVILTNSIEYTP